MPKATIEVKELRVDISKDGGSKPSLFVKLHLLPIVVLLGDPRISCDQSSNFKHGGYTSTSQSSFASMEGTSAPFCCEELSLSSEFDHDRYFFFLQMFMGMRPRYSFSFTCSIVASLVSLSLSLSLSFLIVLVPSRLLARCGIVLFDLCFSEQMKILSSIHKHHMITELSFKIYMSKRVTLVPEKVNGMVTQ